MPLLAANLNFSRNATSRGVTGHEAPWKGDDQAVQIPGKSCKSDIFTPKSSFPRFCNFFYVLLVLERYSHILLAKYAKLIKTVPALLSFLAYYDRDKKMFDTWIGTPDAPIGINRIRTARTEHLLWGVLTYLKCEIKQR